MPSRWRLRGPSSSGDENGGASTSSPGSSRFSIWRRLGRRPWHTAESRDQNFQRGWKCIQNAMASTVRIVPIYRDSNDVMKLLFARKMAAVFQKSHAHKEIYCFQSLTAFIRDFQRAKDRRSIGHFGSCDIYIFGFCLY